MRTWAVRFLSNNHGEPQLPVLPCVPQEETPRPPPTLALDQPLARLMFEVPFARPGGGPRDLVMGAPHNSEVTAVGGGAVSPQVFLDLTSGLQK